MVTQKRQFGDIGEEFAANFLKAKGYKILDRNWLIRGGEIDIVAAKTSGLFSQKIEEIVFAEVKSAQGGDTASAAQNVHYFKQRRLIKTAQTYLAAKKYLNLPWRIDVLLVDYDPFSKAAKIEHLENAVWGK